MHRVGVLSAWCVMGETVFDHVFDFEAQSAETEVALASETFLAH